MNTIYETAIEIAGDQKSVISRLDIQFNFKTQEHKGYLTLANGNEYAISLSGYWAKITA